MFALIKSLRRAASCWAALSFLITSSVWAAGGKEAVLRAQELFLNKNRQGALKILIQARNSTGLKANEREELNESIKDTASRFLTDKGQRSFELGISELPTRASVALTHFNEALMVEDQNIQILEARVRGAMAAEDCKAAQKELQTLQSFFAIAPQLIELELELAWCLEDVSAVENLIKRKTPDQKLNAPLSKMATAWVKWRQNEADRALTLLREVLAGDAKNPAVLYWFWNIQKDQDLDAQAAAAAFTRRCRSYESEFRRRASSMIEMCLHLSEVEAYLKSKGAENTNAG